MRADELRRSAFCAISPPAPVLGTPGVDVPVVAFALSAPVLGTLGAVAGESEMVVPLPVVAPLAGCVTVPPEPVVPLSGYVTCAAATPADKRTARVAAPNTLCNFIMVISVVLETLMFDLAHINNVPVKQR